jgi:hypothetical protein
MLRDSGGAIHATVISGIASSRVRHGRGMMTFGITRHFRAGVSARARTPRRTRAMAACTQGPRREALFGNKPFRRIIL